MGLITAVNDFVIRFANVNGTGSASANSLFAKAIFRMGIPVSPKNIFPSNIQGLPTWYEVRVSDKGYLGRRGGVDIVVCMNPQSMRDDVLSLESGGYFIYDNSRPLDLRFIRDDVKYIGLPLTATCLREYTEQRDRQLFKNVIYVGALAALLNMDFKLVKDLIHEQFSSKERYKKHIAPNVHALELGYHLAKENFDCPLGIRVESRQLVDDKILMEGNAAVALGAIYAGCTVAAWYPITPSTSVVDNFDTYCKRLRIDAGTGSKKYAIIQAEDELSAIGMVIGASWNGARAFTATSGPGVSLMSEFLGLAYFSEVPAVLVDVQRTGPSTGMPTRTQQSDILAAAYASHGDTRHVLLFPSTPKEGFDLMVDAFDLAEGLQTPIIMLSDLDLGMNDHMSDPLFWDDQRRFDRGKVLSAEQLDELEQFGRYQDVDGDGICYRTLPGTHPTKGAFFTRGSSKDEMAIYTEKGEHYVRNMDRLLRKWQTAKTMVPEPVVYPSAYQAEHGVIFFGTSAASTLEAMDYLAEQGLNLDGLRLKAFPFNDTVERFVAEHECIFLVEQNRDAQMKTLLVNELGVDPARFVSVLNYDGMPITAHFIRQAISGHLDEALGGPVTPLNVGSVEAKS
jgi:2-oxoglutarate ferredoxin oxidoreductase subunit alpha